MDGWIRASIQLVPPPGFKAQRVGSLLRRPPVSTVTPTLTSGQVTLTVLLKSHPVACRAGSLQSSLAGPQTPALPWPSADTWWCLWTLVLACFPLLNNSFRAAKPAQQPTGHLPSTLVHTSRARLRTR